MPLVSRGVNLVAANRQSVGEWLKETGHRPVGEFYEAGQWNGVPDVNRGQGVVGVHVTVNGAGMEEKDLIPRAAVD